MDNTAPAPDSPAYQKARLIHAAHETLRAAHLLDERDDLDEASFVEWYDRTLPDVRDIKILAGAMEIELARRRGERVDAEGEQRGRPEKGTQRVTFISNADSKQRSRDRALAEQPAAVDAFIQREVSAGRAPSMRGAVREAALARGRSTPGKNSRSLKAWQEKKQRFDVDLLAVVDRLADGVRRPDAQIAKLAGMSPFDLRRRVRLLPWLTIDQTGEGTRFQIDDDLRAICDGRRPRPELAQQSILDYLRTLRTELTRRRKENHDEFYKRRWNSTLIDKREQTALLDWIEDQLNRLPTL